MVLRQTVRAAGEAEFSTTLNVKSRLRKGMYVLVVYGNGKVDYRNVLVE